MSWVIGVDVGGTFTDFYAYHRQTQRVQVGKRPSTPDDPARAILDGLAELARRFGIDLNQLQRLAHGTTVGTNSLLQRQGGDVVLLTTAGFRDLLEIGRQTRPHMYDLFKDFPPPLVARERRLEVDERISAGGVVVQPLCAAAIERAVEQVEQIGAQACAVCLLFAFENPVHERALGEALHAALPELHLSLSSDVQPEFREYERFSTTVLNAYLQPIMTAYLQRLESALEVLAPGAALGINQSSGGLMSPRRAQGVPVRTALSGPAAGAVGAVHVAGTAARPDVITLDMGGTSADVALIRAGRANIAYHREVAGFPIRVPMVDIETVGAGGGSIAWFDRDGLLKVGPQSAGAAPGPACYAQGGQMPTVTDANLLLGRLSSKGLLGGEMALDASLAREALEPIAKRLDFSVERTAHGVLGVVVANMVRAIRTISVERGHDPRAFTLMPFGGAGPLHARDVAASLGMHEVVVPPAPGIVCAQGLVVSDLKEDFVISRRTRAAPEALGEIRDCVRRLQLEAEDWFATECIGEGYRSVELALDMRYVGQNFELSVPLGSETESHRDAVPELERLSKRFFEVHEATYGYHTEDDPVEIVNFRLTARGRAFDAPEFNAAPREERLPEPLERRRVWFDADAPADCACFERDALAPGDCIVGPAIIEQLDATTPVYPGDEARVDSAGNLLITMTNAGR